MSSFSNTPQPPYYAVIFTSLKIEEDKGYGKMAQRMIELANQEDGFLGLESAREEIGITVSYWKDEESIKKWKANIEHINAQKIGQELWYKQYKVRVAKVERDYEF